MKSAAPLTREDLFPHFLAQNNLTDYQIDKIADDASFRRYFRVKTKQESFILMDAPPEKEDIKPFCNIAEILLNNNLSAPKILGRDDENGLLLLEDFGNDSYTKILAKLKGDELLKKEKEIYQLAIDALLKLHQVPEPQNIALYDEELLMREVMLFIEWYLPYIAKTPASEAQITEFKSLWKEAFKQLSKASKLVLRDYHADNLMLLNERESYRQVGLLDFQDAVIGVEAYDMVSLLEDIRRDVSKETVEAMLQHYLQNSNINQESFLRDYQILSLQRNIKIIGIFSRLAIRDKKEKYLSFLPKLFNYVSISPANDNLSKIRQFISAF